MNELDTLIDNELSKIIIIEIKVTNDCILISQVKFNDTTILQVTTHHIHPRITSPDIEFINNILTNKDNIYFIHNPNYDLSILKYIIDNKDITISQIKDYSNDLINDTEMATQLGSEINKLNINIYKTLSLFDDRELEYIFNFYGYNVDNVTFDTFTPELFEYNQKNVFYLLDIIKKHKLNDIKAYITLGIMNNIPNFLTLSRVLQTTSIYTSKSSYTKPNKVKMYDMQNYNNYIISKDTDLLQFYNDTIKFINNNNDKDIPEIIPTDKNKYTFKIKDLNYSGTLGIGGIHLQALNKKISQEGYKIINIDFTSLYPNIIKDNPEMLNNLKDNRTFLFDKYCSDLQTRLDLKNSLNNPDLSKNEINDNKQKSNALKLILNASYGVLKYLSINASYIIAINGQIKILNLAYDILNSSLSNYNILQINTDGITLEVKDDNVPEFIEFIDFYNIQSDIFKLETTIFDKYVSKDISNYFLIKDDKAVVKKGVFNNDRYGNLSNIMLLTTCNNIIQHYYTTNEWSYDVILPLFIKYENKYLKLYISNKTRLNSDITGSELKEILSNPNNIILKNKQSLKKIMGYDTNINPNNIKDGYVYKYPIIFTTNIKNSDINIYIELSKIYHNKNITNINKVDEANNKVTPLFSYNETIITTKLQKINYGSLNIYKQSNFSLLDCINKQHSFIACSLKDYEGGDSNRKKEDIIDANIIVIDVDSSPYDYDTAINKLKDNNINVNIAYYTMSNLTTDNILKYRLILFFTGSIKEIIEDVFDKVSKILGDCRIDEKSKSINQIWLPKQPNSTVYYSEVNVNNPSDYKISYKLDKKTTNQDIHLLKKSDITNNLIEKLKNTITDIINEPDGTGRYKRLLFLISKFKAYNLINDNICTETELKTLLKSYQKAHDLIRSYNYRNWDTITDNTVNEILNEVKNQTQYEIPRNYKNLTYELDDTLKGNINPEKKILETSILKTNLEIFATYNPDDYTHIKNKDDFNELMGKISNNTNTPLYSHEDLIEKIKKGVFIRYQIFKTEKNYSAENFDYSYYCWIDIDSTKLKIDDVNTLLNKNNLQPTIIYHSFSSNLNNDQIFKYHIIYLLNKKISDSSAYYFLNKAINKKIKDLLIEEDTSIKIDNSSYLKPVRFRNLNNNEYFITDNKLNPDEFKEIKMPSKDFYSTSSDRNELEIIIPYKTMDKEQIINDYIDIITYDKEKQDHKIREEGISKSYYFHNLMIITNGKYVNCELITEALKELLQKFEEMSKEEKKELQQDKLNFEGSSWDKLSKEFVYMVENKSHIDKNKTNPRNRENKKNFEKAITHIKKNIFTFYNKKLDDILDDKLIKEYKLESLSNNENNDIINQNNINQNDINNLCAMLVVYGIIKNIKIIVTINDEINKCIDNFLNQNNINKDIIDIIKYQVNSVSPKNQKIESNYDYSIVILIENKTANSFSIVHDKEKNQKNLTFYKNKENNYNSNEKILFEDKVAYSFSSLNDQEKNPQNLTSYKNNLYKMIFLIIAIAIAIALYLNFHHKKQTVNVPIKSKPTISKNSNPSNLKMNKLQSQPIILTKVKPIHLNKNQNQPIQISLTGNDLLKALIESNLAIYDDDYIEVLLYKEYIIHTNSFDNKKILLKIKDFDAKEYILNINPNKIRINNKYWFFTFNINKDYQLKGYNESEDKTITGKELLTILTKLKYAKYDKSFMEIELNKNMIINETKYKILYKVKYNDLYYTLDMYKGNVRIGKKNTFITLNRYYTYNLTKF